MSSEFFLEIQRPASEVDQLMERVRRCLKPQQLAGLDERLAHMRSELASASAEEGRLNAVAAAVARHVYRA